MPIIASHHASDPWRPARNWPDDCTVQWGGQGIVLEETKSYATAFFEAFPKDGAGGFIRGEGATLEEAEADAHAAYERQFACLGRGGHRWTRARRLDGQQERLRGGRPVPRVSTYTNGGAFCLRCGAFSTVLPEIPRLGAWRDPLSYSDLEFIMMGGLRPNPSWARRMGEADRRASERRRHRLRLRAKLAGIDLPDPEAPGCRDEEPTRPLAEGRYEKACREAVVRFYIRERDRFSDPESGGVLSGMFDGLTRRRLEREADALLAAEGA